MVADTDLRYTNLWFQKFSDINIPNAARKELQKKKEPKYDPELPLNKLLIPIEACRYILKNLGHNGNLYIYLPSWFGRSAVKDPVLILSYVYLSVMK